MAPTKWTLVQQFLFFLSLNELITGNEPANEQPVEEEIVQSKRSGRRSGTRRQPPAVAETMPDAEYEPATSEPVEDSVPHKEMVQPTRGGRRSDGRWQSPVAAALRDESDSDESTTRRKSNRSRRATYRPSLQNKRKGGRRGRTVRDKDREDERSTSTEEYSNDSDTQDNAVRKTKTKLTLRQRNARRRKRSDDGLEQDVVDTSIEEGKVVEDGDENVEETIENYVQNGEQKDGESTLLKDNDLLVPVANAAENLPLKMKIRISRMTEEEIETLSRASDMEVEEPPAVPPSGGGQKLPLVRKGGRRGRKPKLKVRTLAHSKSAAEKDIVYATENTDTIDENNVHVVNENDGQLENEKKDDDNIHEKPEFSSDTEKEGDDTSAAVDTSNKDDSLVWKTATKGENVMANIDVLPEAETEEEPPPPKPTARSGPGSGRRGRRGRGRKGRPPTKRPRVDETVVTDLDPESV